MKTSLRILSKTDAASRSPERQALAGAINRLHEAELATMSVTRGQEAATARWLAADRAVEAAKKELLGATSRTPGRVLADSFLSREDAVTAATSAEAARQALAAAEADLAALRAARDELKRDMAAAENEMRWATEAHANAITAVIMASPALTEAIAAAEAARTEWRRQERVIELVLARLSHLDGMNLLKQRAAIQLEDIPDGPEASAWRIWLVALGSNPDATLDIA